MHAILSAITGPVKGAVYYLYAADVAIGRHASNQFCIADPSVSRRHSIIKPEAHGYRILDNGSNNGTYLNGKRVEEHALADGDRISIGETVLEFVVPIDDDSESRVVIPGSPDAFPSSTIRLRPKSPPEDAAGIGSRITGPVRPLDSIAPTGQARPSGGLPDADTLADLGRILNSDLPLESLCRALFEALERAVPVYRGAILLAGSAQDPPSSLRWGKTGSGSVDFSVDAAIVERALAQSQPLLAHVPVWNSSEPKRPRAGSVMAVPLPGRRQCEGLVYLETDPGGRHFDSGDLQCVSLLAGYIGLALRAARRQDRPESTVTPAVTGDLEREMVGESRRMRVLYERLSRIAVTQATVLVRGETGTGKELAARAIHRNSPRAGKAFETVNCALLKDNFLESELFGHEKGAFTGAVAQRKGKFEMADGGSIFLDEVGELPLPTQSMLLRVLQERSFHRLGGSRLIHVDVRVIAATNRDLEKAIQEGSFRSDLYYRLNVVSVLLPPLRERREDIPRLAEHFLRSCSAKNSLPLRSISNEALRCVQTYDWPGNVRELENAIEYAVVFGAGGEIERGDLPERIAGPDEATEPASEDNAEESSPGILRDAVKAVKTRLVLEALEKANGNHTAAAKLLGVHPNNLQRLLRTLNLGTMRARGEHP